VNGKIYLINDKTFAKEVLQGALPVLVECWAKWCDPCKIVSQTLERMSEAYASFIKITRLDIDKSAKTKIKYDIQSIPTLMLFKNGKVIAIQVGELSRERLITFIESQVLHGN
jgi:thioredoxin 1